MSTSAASRRSSIAPKHPSTFINGAPAQKPSISCQPSVPSSPSLPRTTSTSKVPQKLNMAVANGAMNSVAHRAKPVRKKALTATQQAAKATPPVPVHASPFEIMASRIANRVAEMAENISFIERPLPKAAEPEPVNGKKPPRKLEIRFPQSTGDVQFSAPFLDNTLAKMLQLQNRMLKTGSELAASEAPEAVKKEQFEQSAELSRIIALICAEKARQGA